LEAKSNYTIVGILVLFLASGLLSTALWLSVGFNQKVYTLYTVYLHEAASGLSEQAPVKFNGVQVGFVKKIKLNKNDPRQVELVLSIEEGTPITTSTTATLISQGITGVTYVGLSAASADLTPLEKMPDEPYPVIPAKPSLFNQLDAILREVSENMNALSVQIKQVFNEENAHYVKHTLGNMEKITAVIVDNSKNINESLDSANLFLANIAKISKELPNVVKDLKLGAKKFNVMANDLSAAGKNVSQTMVAGKNTMSKISDQTLPEASILLRRLNAISANLEKISNEMRQNPSVIIRGAATPKSGPGE
jgi:phospholipid/cholesterol/gamma-HCH transport system substrate-binding protein